MAQTVKEKLFESVVNGNESQILIYHAVQQGMVALNDPAHAIPYEQLDEEAIRKTPYEIDSFRADIKLFGIQRNAEKIVMYFAETEDDAQSLHHRTAGDNGLAIWDFSDKMDSLTCNLRTKNCRSFRDILKEVYKFPYLIGEGNMPAEEVI